MKSYKKKTEEKALKVRNKKTQEIFQVFLDPEIFKVVSGERGVEVVDLEGNKKMFRRDFLEIF